MNAVAFPLWEAIAAALRWRIPEPWDRNPPEVWVAYWRAYAAWLPRNWWRRVRHGPWYPGARPFPAPPIGPRPYFPLIR